jgi:hypothetical protein
LSPTFSSAPTCPSRFRSRESWLSFTHEGFREPPKVWSRHDLHRLRVDYMRFAGRQEVLTKVGSHLLRAYEVLLVSHSSSIFGSRKSISVRISSSPVRTVCSCTSYRWASERSNQAPAGIFRGTVSFGCFPNNTPNAKLSASSVSCGNQRSGISGERVNHFRPLGPWQTSAAGKCRPSSGNRHCHFSESSKSPGWMTPSSSKSSSMDCTSASERS